jgi:NhaA family Na+:H+ antiporter
MSLFISTLAFTGDMEDHGIEARLGILAGSFLSAVIGYLVLRYSLQQKPDQDI